MKRWLTVLHVALVIGVGVAELLGARAYVGALSGTLPASEGALVVGLAYALAYFLAVVWAPIWFLAMFLEAAYGRLGSWISRAR